MKIPLRYLFQDRDRHGNERLYVRRNDRKIRIKERWGTPEFLEAYRAALVATDSPKVEPRRFGAPAKQGTFQWLVQQYYRSAEFNQLDDSTKRVRRGILDGLCIRYGGLPYAQLEPHNVRRLLDEKAAFPEAANAH
jgi:hypothetical protein